MKPLVITIDGPAGAGKTTVSKILANRLGYRYVDTGALYRGIAYEARARDIKFDDDAGLKKLFEGLDFKFEMHEKQLRLFSGRRDITDHIRTPEISMQASAVSANPVVRDYLLEFQRQLGQRKKVVFEGRDTGTIVFPEADVKFFLDASSEARAIRRFKQIDAASDHTLENVKGDMEKRDNNDATRSVAPLMAADDAVKIDCTDLSIEEVIGKMVAVIEQQYSVHP